MFMNIGQRNRQTDYYPGAFVRYRMLLLAG